jgi:hypothetical protein
MTPHFARVIAMSTTAHARAHIAHMVVGDRSRTRANAREAVPSSRRTLLAGAVTLPVVFVSTPRAARAAELTTYTDPRLKFQVTYPNDWVTLAGETPAAEDILGGGARDVFTIAPPDADVGKINISIVATPAGADFTKMGSLGDAYGFGFGLTAPLNRPKVRKGRESTIQYCELVDAVQKGDYYKVEYTFAKPSTGFDSLQFVLAGLGYDGRVSHLYTATATLPRGEEEKWRSTVEAIIDSIQYPPTLY